MSEDFCAFALRVSVVLLSGRSHIDFCNCLIHSKLSNSVWISGKKTSGNPRLNNWYLIINVLQRGLWRRPA